MSDNEIDAELLALADDDSASEAEEHISPGAPKSKSASPSPRPSTNQQARGSTDKGVARPKQGSATRLDATSVQVDGQNDSDEEGEASSANSPRNSLGSDAMSESDSDATYAKDDDGILFPVDGIFRSEKEKAQINAMPEIERERLLAERAEEAEKLAQSAKLRQLMQAREKAAEKSSLAQKKRKATSADLEDSPRKSSRAKTKQSENLAAYKAQREQRNEQRKLGDARKRRDNKSPSQDIGHSDGEADGESEVEWDDGASKAPAAREDGPPTLRDFERVRVGRTNFAKCCFHPGFDEKIRGCFARVSIGINKATGENTYRMTQIKGFVTGKPYTIEPPEGLPFLIDQYAVLAHGKSEKEWPFIACSDSRFTDAELSRWLSTLAADGTRVPTTNFLSTKCDDIHTLLDQRWADEAINNKMRRMHEIRASATAYEKERLEKQRKLALANNNEAEVARLDSEIAVLNGEKPKPSILHNGAMPSNSSTQPGSGRALTQQERLAAINRANRKANTEEIRKAQIEEKRQSAKAQREAIPNPFLRVKTRARVHHDANGGDSLVARKKDDLFGDTSDISRAATPAGGSSRAGTPTLVGDKPSTAPKTAMVVPRSIEKTGTGGVSKTRMDDDVLGAMDLGIEIDI